MGEQPDQKDHLLGRVKRLEVEGPVFNEAVQRLSRDVEKTRSLNRVLYPIFIVLLLVNIFAMIGQTNATQERVEDTDNNGNITRQLLCETIAYDSDRVADPPPICFSPEIASLYEQSFCNDYPDLCVAADEPG